MLGTPSDHGCSSVIEYSQNLIFAHNIIWSKYAISCQNFRTRKLFEIVVKRQMSIKVHCVIYPLIRKIFRNWYAKKKKISVTHTFSLGCSSVIEYSRNLIWPRSVFSYIKCLMLIFIWYAYKFK